MEFDRVVEENPRQNIVKSDRKFKTSLHNQYSMQARHWFSVSTAFGDVKLGFTPFESNLLEKEDLIILDAAHSLGRDESIVRLIEDWINIPLDVNYSEYSLPAENVSVSVSLMNDAKEVSTENVVVSLPINLLPNLVNPISVESLPINTDWQEVNCNICIAEIEVDKEKVQRLEEGSLLLIPNSFSYLWLCRVYLNNNEIGLPLMFTAQLDKSSFSLSFDIDDNQKIMQATKNSKALLNQEMIMGGNDSVISLLSIELEAPLLIDIGTLLGWDSSLKPFLTKSVSQPILPTMTIKQNNQCIGCGHLLPVADGFGLLLDSLVNPDV